MLDWMHWSIDVAALLAASAAAIVVLLRGRASSERLDMNLVMRQWKQESDNKQATINHLREQLDPMQEQMRVYVAENAALKQRIEDLERNGNRMT